MSAALMTTLDNISSRTTALQYYIWTMGSTYKASTKVDSDPEPINCEIRNGRVKQFNTMRELIDDLDS